MFRALGIYNFAFLVKNLKYQKSIFEKYVTLEILNLLFSLSIKMGSIFEQGLEYFDYFIWRPNLKSKYNPDRSLVHTIVCTHRPISLEDASTLYSLSPLAQKNLFAFRVILRNTFEVKKMVSKLQTVISIFCICHKLFYSSYHRPNYQRTFCPSFGFNYQRQRFLGSRRMLYSVYHRQIYQRIFCP